MPALQRTADIDRVGAIGPDRGVGAADGGARKVSQVATKPQAGRRESGERAAARELGIERTGVRRADGRGLRPESGERAAAIPLG